MSSTNKTKNLGLNSWVGTDIPKREDFNNDNVLLDTAINGHTSNDDIHVTTRDKSRWNEAPYVIKTYYGDGELSRTIELGMSSRPTFAIIIGTSVFPSIIDLANKSMYNYFGIATRSGSTTGTALTSDGNVKVGQSATAVSQYNYRSFNEVGIAYVIIAFK